MKKSHFIILTIIILLIIPLYMLISGQLIFYRYTVIDINSGDLRHRTRIFSFVIKDEIQETPFSMEVRRLGIPINEDRKWESLYYGYGKTISHCAEIIGIFDSTNMTDQDRINILQRVLEGLQKGNHKEIDGIVETLFFERIKKTGDSNEIE